MKHLNKFNEAYKSVIDRDYMSECFINIIDHYDAEVGISESESVDDSYDDEDNEWSITINLPHIAYKEDKKWYEIKFDDDMIENTIKKSEAIIELYKEIKASIERVKINYQRIRVSYEIEQEDVNLDWRTRELADAYIMVNFTISKKPNK